MTGPPALGRQRPGPRHIRKRFGWAGEIVAIVVLAAPVAWLVAYVTRLPDWIQQVAKWLSVLLVAIIVVALIARPFLVAANKRRWKRFAAQASDYGVRYTPENPALVATWRLDPSRTGRARARNVITGRVGGREFVAFDYRLSRAREAPDEFRVLLVSLPGRLPQLKVSVPLEVTHGGAVPRRLDIDIEDEEFNRRYRVRSYDGSSAARKYAVDVLNPRAVEWLLSAPPFAWAVAGNSLLTYTIGWFDPKYVEEQILRPARVLAGVADAIPAFVFGQRADR